MELKVISTFEGIEAVQAEWLELLQHSCNRGIHQRYDWFSASIKSYHLNDELHVPVVFDDHGRLSCIAPLVITWRAYRGIKVRAIGFVRNEQSPANDFVFSPGSEDISLKLIFEYLTTFRHWEFIDLHMVHAEGPIWSFAREFLKERKIACGVKLNRQSPYISIDRDWTDYWNSRSKRFRKAMRNKLNRIEKHSGLTIEKMPIASGSAQALEEMIRISANSWKRKTGTDLAASKNRVDFYRTICDTWGPDGLIHVWFLRLDQEAVAFEFHIEHKGTVYPIRADYDEKYREISPGSLLEYEIIRSIFQEKKIAEYNSCGHTYDYLLNWADLTRDYRNIEAFKRNPKMIMLHAFEYHVLVMLRRAKFYDSFKKLIYTFFNIWASGPRRGGE